MQSQFIFILAGLFASAVLSGCKGYSVSVNENVVYTPSGIFKDYAIADAQLSACVKQTIDDLHIVNAEALTRLNCSTAGIKSLAGLEKFFALEELNLTENQLVDIQEIAQLGRLKILLLSKNKIKSGAPLLHLLHLQQLDLADNNALACTDLHQLQANMKGTKLDIKLPSQCAN